MNDVHFINTNFSDKRYVCGRMAVEGSSSTDILSEVTCNDCIAMNARLEVQEKEFIASDFSHAIYSECETLCGVTIAQDIAIEKGDRITCSKCLDIIGSGGLIQQNMEVEEKKTAEPEVEEEVAAEPVKEQPKSDDDILEALEAAQLSLKSCVNYFLGNSMAAIPEPEAIALTVCQIDRMIEKIRS